RQVVKLVQSQSCTWPLLRRTHLGMPTRRLAFVFTLSGLNSLGRSLDVAGLPPCVEFDLRSPDSGLGSRLGTNRKPVLLLSRSDIMFEMLNVPPNTRLRVRPAAHRTN